MASHRRFNIPLHSNDALKTMNDLRRKGELCDVVLHVDGHEFPAHKIVLAGASSYLRAMFTNGMLESGMKDIKLHNFDLKLTIGDHQTEVNDQSKDVLILNKFFSL